MIKIMDKKKYSVPEVELLSMMEERLICTSDFPNSEVEEVDIADVYTW